MSTKILIADDEPNIVISLEYLMKREGFEVSVARDGAEALSMMAADVPDLLLLDAMMPNTDGFEVLQALQGRPERPKVIMLTAKGRESDIEKGRALGADDYVVKPFSTAELVERVRKLLGGGDGESS
ncbi:MAG: response regulator transcription factor [Wenzhouxiangella sp.]